jgi:sugar phosphate isomerase/epimerase
MGRCGFVKSEIISLLPVQGDIVKLGFFTAALPNQTLEQVAQWGAESGFQAIEIACWPQEKAARRYAA